MPEGRVNMGKKWTEWQDTEKELALQMRQEKYTYQEIVNKLGKSFQAINGFFKRHDTAIRLEKRMNGEIVTNSRCLPEIEHERRMELYNKGLTDIEAGEVLEISSHAYTSWRIARGLKPHIRHAQKSHTKTVPITKVPEQRKVFTIADLKYYKHNPPSKIVSHYGELKIIADKELVEREFQRLGIVSVGTLNHGMIAQVEYGYQ